MASFFYQDGSDGNGYSGFFTYFYPAILALNLTFLLKTKSYHMNLIGYEIFFPLAIVLAYIALPVLVIIGFVKLYNTFKESVRAKQEQNEIMRELVTHLKSKNL